MADDILPMSGWCIRRIGSDSEDDAFGNHDQGNSGKGIQLVHVHEEYGDFGGTFNWYVLCF